MTHQHVYAHVQSISLTLRTTAGQYSAWKEYRCLGCGAPWSAVVWLNTRQASLPVDALRAQTRGEA